MHHIIFRLLLTSIIVIVMVETSAVNALFMFFVAGTVPGTNYVVPANTMMLTYCALICAVLLHALARNFLRARLASYLQALRQNSESVSTHAVQ